MPSEFSRHRRRESAAITERNLKNQSSSNWLAATIPLVVQGGDLEVTYSIRSNGGELMASDLTDDQFKVDFPTIYAKFKGALASGKFLYASVETFGDSRFDPTMDSPSVAVESE